MKGHAGLPWLLIGSIVLVVFLGQFSLLSAPRVTEAADGLPLERGISTFLTVLMLLIGPSQIATVRWLFLPQVARMKRATPEQIALVSLMFAAAPCVYGVVIVTFTGQGLLTLPFSALSLVGIALIYPYLKQVVAALE